MLRSIWDLGVLSKARGRLLLPMCGCQVWHGVSENWAHLSERLSLLWGNSFLNKFAQILWTQRKEPRTLWHLQRLKDLSFWSHLCFLLPLSNNWSPLCRPMGFLKYRSLDLFMFTLEVLSCLRGNSKLVWDPGGYLMLLPKGSLCFKKTICLPLLMWGGGSKNTLRCDDTLRSSSGMDRKKILLGLRICKSQ